MLLVNQIRENYATVLTGLQKRNISNAQELLDQAIALDDRRKSSQTERDQLQAEANALSKSIGQLMKEGKKEEAEAAKAKTGEIKSQIKGLEEENSLAEESLRVLLYTIPNVPHSSVPAGKSAEDNEIVLEHGSIPSLFEGKLPHWELIKKYDIIDFDLGVKITGAGFPVYKGKGARLQRALINFFLDEAL
ncbi:MAG: serine--tRNA ligase, partial [Cytophagales bacterium]